MIVSVARLRDYMSGIGLNVHQTQAAEDVLAGVQRELESYLGRRLEVGTYTEPVRLHKTGGWVEVEHSPVVSVTTPGYHLDSGMVYPDYWSPPPTLGVPETITYVAGYDGRAPELADVRLAIMRVAAREMEPRHDETRSVRDLNTTRTASVDVQRKGATGWTADELEQFSQLRKRVTR